MTIDELTSKLRDLCVLQEQRLAVAESCTGGAIVNQLTSVAGASSYIDCSFIAYSHSAKTRMLGISTELMVTHGSVSLEVAEAMAKGALKNSEGTIALGVTGIAGPSGGSPHKPVGTVCSAWVLRCGRVEKNRHCFFGGRIDIRDQTVRMTIESGIKLLEQRR